MELPARISKYELVEYLGGGMSRVYRADDTLLGRQVAVKVLSDAGNADQEARARFLREAKTAVTATHENIIAVYDFGEEQGRPFMVMEFLVGESLRDAISNNHTGDLHRKLEISLQIAKALQYVHSKRIIHRDVKPDNIHLDSTGKVKLMDFGIAKAEGMALTRAGFTLGTPYYMAPEQVLGQTITPQVDVYAFGVMLVEIMAGIKPITGQTVEEIFRQILYQPLQLDALHEARLPASVINLVERCTAKSPAERVAGFDQITAELEYIIRDPSAPPRLTAPKVNSATPPVVTPVAPVGNPVRQTAPPAKPPVTRPRPSSPGEGTMEVPAFMNALPKPLRSQNGLMLVTMILVLLVLVILFVGARVLFHIG